MLERIIHVGQGKVARLAILRGGGIAVSFHDIPNEHGVSEIYMTRDQAVVFSETFQDLLGEVE